MLGMNEYEDYYENYKQSYYNYEDYKQAFDEVLGKLCLLSNNNRLYIDSKITKSDIHSAIFYAKHIQTLLSNPTIEAAIRQNIKIKELEEDIALLKSKIG